jgi:LuxR family transcriptional regulator, maltose regulon positive regulatory protein
VVARTALFDLLSAGFAGGITLISAPAGSGKTVLLRSWIEAAGLGERTAWVSVERDERDVQHFWLSVVEALRGAAGVQEPIEDLGPAPQIDGEAVVARIAAGAGSLDEPVLLVIDDLDQVHEPSALAQLELLLAHRPPQLRVILSTRHDPSLGLHRYRLAGELTEVRATDLRFQPDETSQLLAGAGIALSDSAVGSLLARTEGWVAGLRLAALSLASQPDPEHFVAEFSGSERTVADYLFAEVLQAQPEPVRRLLLRTSILERVNGPLADRLLGTTGSERILLELEDANAFVFSIDPQRSWFRYHQLFADLLRLELRRTDPDSVPALHHAAAEWYAGHQFPIDAIRHAQAATDWRLAGDLIGRYGFSIALDGSFATMWALLEAFPAETLANPELAAFLAYGEVIRPSLDTAASYIAVAERHASEVPEERRQAFDAMLATARMTLARWHGDYGTLVSEVGPLLEPVEAETVSEVAAANDVRAVALMTLGTVELWAGAGDDAERHLKEGLELARRNGRPYVEMGCLGHLAVAVGRRSLTEMRELATQTIQIMEKYGWMSEPIAPMVLATMGAVDVWQGRFDEAQPWLDRSEHALRPDAEPAKALLVRYCRGIQRLGQGRLAEALAAFVEVQRLQSLMASSDPLAIQARGLHAQTLVRLGDLQAARAALATASDAEREHAETRAALAAIQLAEHDARGAIDVLAHVLAGTAPIVRDFSVINGLLLDALARDALGDAKAAEDDVERALDLAEPDALILPFLIVPARHLLERHPRHRTAHAALLANVLDVLAGSPLRARRPDLEDLTEELTESEIRVLRYLPSNLSAPEIAAEIFLSTSTVKTHMRHIYEKLGAHRRTEAVDLARVRGLLGPSARTRR